MNYTATKISEADISIKNSKFISYCFSATNEGEVQEFITQLKLKNKGANHFCYAYRFGKIKINERANDDGEPSGSAGLPILNALKSNKLTNTAIVVIRYFGGTKLGQSGLIKSYKQAAIESIENNNLGIIELRHYCYIKFTYDITAAVEQILHRENARIESQDFSVCVEMEISATNNLFTMISNELQKYTDCQVKYLGYQ